MNPQLGFELRLIEEQSEFEVRMSDVLTSVCMFV